MFEACLTAGVDAAAKHYQDGCSGGRPSKLTEVDQEIIASLKQQGQTAAMIAKQFGVSDKTIRRSTGWTKVDKTKGQNVDKTQNQEEKEKEKEKEEEKENPASASFAPNCPVDFDALGRQVSANHADQIMREYATAAAKEKAREVITSRPTDNSR